ncbi:MAG: DUF1461 domain-containing protein, partial [Chloroflexota bacterium]
FAVLISARLLAGRLPGWSPRSYWGAVRVGSLGLLVGMVVAGLISAFAFDAAFEVFHELFFPAGTYLFNPQTDRLVQLFPEQFWLESSIAVGAVAVALSLVTIALIANRRDRHPATPGLGR